MEKKLDAKKFWLDLFPILVTGIALVVLGIVFKQKFIKLLPTLVSLLVMLLSAKANRFTFLFGGLNAVVYAIGYFMEGLYPSMVSALAISFPFQIASFILWSKNQTEAKQVRVRRLNAKGGILAAVASVVFWIICYFIYKQLGTTSLILDNTTFVLGILTTVLSMLRYIEYTFISPISLIISIVMWIDLSVSNIANITYVIYTVYALFRQIQATVTWIKLYREQHQTKDEQAINDGEAERNAEE